MTFKLWIKAVMKRPKFEGGVQSVPANNLGRNDTGSFRICFSSDKLNGFSMCDY